jgi:hypothetical protein
VAIDSVNVVSRVAATALQVAGFAATNLVVAAVQLGTGADFGPPRW